MRKIVCIEYLAFWRPVFWPDLFCWQQGWPAAPPERQTSCSVYSTYTEQTERGPPFFCCRHRGSRTPSYLSYYGGCGSLACRSLTLSSLCTAGSAVACRSWGKRGWGRSQIWRQEKNCRPLSIYNPFLRVFTSHLSTPLYISLFIIRLKRDFSGNRTDSNPDAVFSLFTQKTNETKRLLFLSISRGYWVT